VVIDHLAVAVFAACVVGFGLATALAARTVADGLRQMQQQVRHRPDVTASLSSRCTKVAPVTVRTG
jgi:hypothetical protein